MHSISSTRASPPFVPMHDSFAMPECHPAWSASVVSLLQAGESAQATVQPVQPHKLTSAGCKRKAASLPHAEANPPRRHVSKRARVMLHSDGTQPALMQPHCCATQLRVNSACVAPSAHLSAGRLTVAEACFTGMSNEAKASMASHSSLLPNRLSSGDASLPAQPAMQPAGPVRADHLTLPFSWPQHQPASVHVALLFPLGWPNNHA